MPKLQDQADFGALVHALAQDVVDAHIHFTLRGELIRHLEGKPDARNQSPNFWNLTLRAHEQTALHALFRVYDQEPKTLHLRSWLLTIQGNLDLFSNESFRKRLAGNPFVESLVEGRTTPDPQRLKSDIASCTASDLVVRRLIVFRNTYSAHRATAPVLQRKVGDELALTYEDVRMLLTRAIGILNVYSVYFSASHYSVNLVGRDDFNYIIDCVDAAVQKAKEEWGRPHEGSTSA